MHIDCRRIVDCIGIVVVCWCGIAKHIAQSVAENCDCSRSCSIAICFTADGCTPVVLGLTVHFEYLDTMAQCQQVLTTGGDVEVVDALDKITVINRSELIDNIDDLAMVVHDKLIDELIGKFVVLVVMILEVLFMVLFLIFIGCFVVVLDVVVVLQILFIVTKVVAIPFRNALDRVGLFTIGADHIRGLLLGRRMRAHERVKVVGRVHNGSIILIDTVVLTVPLFLAVHDGDKLVIFRIGLRHQIGLCLIRADRVSSMVGTLNCYHVGSR